MPPAGFEPARMAPEATALSPELRGLGAARVAAWHAEAMRSILRRNLRFVAQVMRAFTANRLALLAAGIAFFAALALAPTLFAFGALGTLVIPRDDLEAVVAEALGQLPKDVSDAVLPGILQITAQGSASALTVSSVVAVIVAVYAASKVVLGLRMSLDAIFTGSRELQGFVPRLFAGLFAFIGIVVFAILAASLTVVPRILGAFGVDVSGGLQAWGGVATVVLLYLGIRALYRHGPHMGLGHVVAVPWASPAVLLATVWVVASTVFFGLYVSVSGALGAAIALFGASVVFLVWLYVVVLGVLIGAQVLAISDPRASEAAPPPAR